MTCSQPLRPLVRTVSARRRSAAKYDTKSYIAEQPQPGMVLAGSLRAIPSAKRGGEVVDQILGRLEADREPHQSVGDALAAADLDG